MSKVIFTTQSGPATIGLRIHEAMERKGMKQSQLCQMLGIKSSSMSNLISGKTKSPNAINLIKLAEILEVNQKWLMTGQGHPDDKRILVADEEIHRSLDRLSADKKQAIAAAIEAFLLTE
jgi:transcriptional regulator with XRE-family HTH domain